MRIAIDLALDRDFGEVDVFASQFLVVVVKNQLDAGLTHRLTAAGAIEDDIRHLLATQVLGGTFAHHPAHGVDHIGFAAAIRANDGAEAGRKVNCGGVYEGFETS